VADPTTVRDALASLATDESRVTPAPRSPHEDYRRTIHEASVATDDVTAAATFAADVGVVRLRRAVRAAARRGDEEAVTIGREALDRIERFRRATDHFHSARGTVLGGDGQRRDE
jgi:N-acetylglucosamine kinase-like BadF-type ATPase